MRRTLGFDGHVPTQVEHMSDSLRFGWRVPTHVGKVAGSRTAIADAGRDIESRDVAQFG